MWKTGKTNIALRLSEDMIHFGLIELVGTNIKIKETEHFKFIEDMQTLKKFHYDDPNNPKHKVFIFDEAGKLAVKRGAMRKENVEWMKFIPELSKGRMKLIVITQAEFLTDSLFTQTEFTRATITAYHHDTYGYSISIESELIKPNFLYINKFPKTSITYSPYEGAEWYLEARTMIKERQFLLCCEIAYEYGVKDKSTTIIANERKWDSRRKVTRLLKRHLRHTFNEMTPQDMIELKNEVNDYKTPISEEMDLKADNFAETKEIEA